MPRFGRTARSRSPAELLVERGFEALADALLYGGDIKGACHEIARRYADSGLTLDEVLGGISRTTRLVGHGEPTFEAARSAALAWTEASLRFHHGAACDDPLTGLSSLPHLRSHLGALYREAERSGTLVSPARALVVVDVVERVADLGRLSSSLRQLELAQLIRAVFSGEEVIAAINTRRVCVLARRDVHLGPRTSALIVSIERWTDEHFTATHSVMHTRIWIEGLPSANDVAALVLDELAR
jgi:hypothetical protein